MQSREVPVTAYQAGEGFLSFPFFDDPYFPPVEVHLFDRVVDVEGKTVPDIGIATELIGSGVVLPDVGGDVVVDGEGFPEAQVIASLAASQKKDGESK